MYSLPDEIDAAVVSRLALWRGWLSSRLPVSGVARTDADRWRSEDLVVSAAGWKVVDPAQYDRRITDLRRYARLMSEVRSNDRWLARCVLWQPLPRSGLQLIKLMERRPGNKDPAGFDHLDYYCPDLLGAERWLRSLVAGPDWSWEWQSNDAAPDHRWISVFICDADNLSCEFKLKPYTVLAIAADELARAELTLYSC